MDSVVAGAAIDKIVPIASVDGVDAGAAGNCVLSVIAEDRVVAGVAEEEVVKCAAVNGVVSGAAMDCHRVGDVVGNRDFVVARETVDDDCTGSYEPSRRGSLLAVHVDDQV